jgi:FdhD protein
LNDKQTLYQPELSQQGLIPTHPVAVVNEFGEQNEQNIPGELPLTIRIDDTEIVTLMTLGSQPEALTLGYVRNQKLIEDLHEIKSVHVDWDRELVQVTTRSGEGIDDWQEKLNRKIVTSGCGQGTVFSCTLDKLYDVRLPKAEIQQSQLYELIRQVGKLNHIYRQAGAVHGCGLCEGTESLIHVEDVGRHNAADAVSGHMWLQGITGEGKIFYTTGRLTSEIVMKTAFMGVPALVSRSGVTQMGLELAQDLGVTVIARAKGRHFLVYHGAENVEFDAIPPKRTVPPPTKGMMDLRSH